MNKKLRLTKEEQSRVFLEWYESELEKHQWKSEHVARLGEFSASLISKYRSGESGIGKKTVERAARAFGYTDAAIARLLQILQLMPGDPGEAGGSGSPEVNALITALGEISDPEIKARIIRMANVMITDEIERERAQRRAEIAAHSRRTLGE